MDDLDEVPGIDRTTVEVMRIASFAETLSALAEVGLQPCLMRADGNPATWSNELDLIVLPSKVRTTLSVLRDLGWEIKNTGFFDPSRRHLLLWSDGQFLKIDLYTKIVSAGLEYIDAKRYLAGASMQGDVFVPLTENWLLHIVVNTILEKQSLRDEYRPRIASSLQDQDAVRQTVIEAGRLGLAYLFEGDRELGFLFDEDRIATLRPGVRKALLKACAANKARLVWRWTMQKIGTKLALRPGFSIAIIGPDGAGKTTFITTLGAMLNRHGIETGSAYFGPWERTVLPSSKALRSLGADPLDIGEDSPARRTTLKLVKAHVRRILYYANFLPEMWARYALRVWPSILERHVMLLDRHAVDLEVGYYNQPMSNFAWLRFLLARLSPRPRMFILLDNDAEVIWNRKKEFSLALIQSSLARYRKVASEYGMIVIKTNRPAAELVNELIEQRWRDFVRLRRDGLPILRKR
jgi:thymidylate kinase